MPMDMQPVEGSSNITAAGYDPTQKILRVEFQGGKKYDYHGAPEHMFDDLMASNSPGSYLATIVKPGCPASKVEEET